MAELTNRVNKTVPIILTILVFGIVGWRAWRARQNPITLLTPTVGVMGPIRLQMASDSQFASPPTLQQDSLAPLPLTVQRDGNVISIFPSESLKPNTIYHLRLQGESWQIRTHIPKMVWMSPAAADSELWWREVGQAAEQVTHTGGKVYDFATSPAGESVAYAVVNAESGLDLWVLDSATRQSRVVLLCGRARCTEPAWNPTGELIAFSRQERPFASSAEEPAPQVWILEVATGKADRSSESAGHSPSWSPDGRWLAFFNETWQGIQFINWGSRETGWVPSGDGRMGEWHPNSQTMLFNELTIQEEQRVTALYQVDMATRAKSLFTEIAMHPSWEEIVGTPAWNSAADRLAVSVRVAGAGMGAQIWLVGGGEAVPIAAELGYTYGAVRWSPDGSQILYQRFSLLESFATPSVFLYDLPTGEAILVAEDANLPEWLP